MDAALRSLPDEMLECRMMSSHPFQRVHPDKVGELVGFSSIAWSAWGFICPRCGMKRRLDAWDALGRLSGRRYFPPDHYRLVVSGHRPMAADYRREIIRRERSST